MRMKRFFYPFPASRNCNVYPVMPPGAVSRIFLLIAGLLLAQLAPAPALAQGGRVYKVEKLSIKATAADAVAAKKKAIAEAERQAMNIVLRRITPFSAYERLPKPKPALIEELLEGFSVRREGNSRTEYLATLDFTFQPDSVRQFLQGYGIPFNDTQAPQVKMVPILLRDGKIVKEGKNDWRKAWKTLDLDHALTPVRMLPLESGMTDEQAQAALAGDRAAFDAIARLYQEDVLVLAVASADDKDGKFSTRLYGVDRAGPIDLARFDRIGPDGVADAAKRAAMIELRIIEGRWKLARSPSDGANDDAPPVDFAMTAEFAGLPQWQKMRSQLTRVPGVQGLDVVSLSARAANVTLQFPGGAGRLSQQLSRHGLYLQNEGGAWILRTN